MTSVAEIIKFGEKLEELVSEFAFMAPEAVVSLVIREMTKFAPGLMSDDLSSPNAMPYHIDREVRKMLAKIK